MNDNVVDEDEDVVQFEREDAEDSEESIRETQVKQIPGADSGASKKQDKPARTAEDAETAAEDTMLSVPLKLRTQVTTLADDQKSLKRRLEKVEKKKDKRKRSKNH